MNAAQRRLLALNVVGGTAVLGSYVWGLAHLGDAAQRAWGGVPESWRGLYTVNMFAAAAGYFPFTGLLLFGVDAERTQFAARLRYGALHWIYAVILLGSALWLPLTCVWLERGGAALWALIHLDLLAVGLASVTLFAALASMRPRPPRWAHLLALAGAVPFVVQTAILDALVWPAYTAG